ncbi:hypothetical protein SDC9_83054 [bioreactor metagenome]|uniref:DUF481 domain-containing protein n=1 Tax=bioreactor metagenome TaxID=1076179 RepID=A0A644Z760_9ZZZZ
MRIFITALALLWLATAQAQLLNIEQQRIITDTTGWSGTAGFTSSYTKNSKSLLNISMKDHVQYKTDSSLYLIFLDYGLTKSQESDFDNAGTLHFRYNYKIKPFLTFEAFTQGQFNKLLDVRFRWLTGCGPRFKAIGKKNFRVYLASLYMYEYEEVVSPLLYHRDHRLSNYISITWKHKGGSILTNTLYYQPLIRDFSDYRVFNQLDLSVKISKKLSFTTSWRYFFDSNPPERVVHCTQNLSNGITWKF